MYIIDDFNNTRIDDLIRIIFCTKWLPVLIAGCMTKIVYENRNYLLLSIIPISVIVCYIIEYRTYSIIGFLFVFLFICWKRKERKIPVLFKLGSISFIWYLLHQNIGYCLMNQLRLYGFYEEYILVLIAMVCTLFLSYIIDIVCKSIPSKLM